MALDPTKLSDRKLRRELDRAERVVREAAQQDGATLTDGQRADVLANAKLAAGRAAELRQEQTSRSAARAAAAREVHGELASSGSARGFLEEQTERLAERRATQSAIALEVEEERRRDHERAVADGRILPAPKWSGPSPDLLAVLASDDVFGSLIGRSFPGLVVADPDTGTTTSHDELTARTGGRMAPLLDSNELLVLFVVLSWIARTDGESIRVRRRSPGFWPDGFSGDRRAALNRLAELGYLTFVEAGDEWELAVGAKTRELRGRYAKVYPVSPAKRGLLRRSSSSDAAELEAAGRVARARVEDEASEAPGRVSA